MKFRVTIDCTPNHINRMKYGCVNSNLRKVKKKKIPVALQPYRALADGCEIVRESVYRDTKS